MLCSTLVNWHPNAILRFGNAAVGAVAISLLIWSAVYAGRPGPSSYYSHFTGLIIAVCLLFQTLQFAVLLATSTHNLFLGRLRIVTLFIYWTTITLSGLVCLAAFSRTPKPDCIGLQCLVFLHGICVLVQLSCLFRRRAIESSHFRNSSSIPLSDRHPTGDSDHPQSMDKPKRNCIHQITARILDGFNRLMMFIHWLLVVLLMSGSITLALQYRFENPGRVVSVHLPGGLQTQINYRCFPAARTANSSQPTIWFQADSAHGVVDFLGVQTALSSTYGIPSCSYDPPNFGWSSRLRSDLPYTTDYFEPLLEALNRTEEKRILAGWGDGLRNSLKQAISAPNVTEALLVLDAAPDGIEWEDAARFHQWNATELAEYRQNDLEGRIILSQLVLSLGMAWGLTPIFVPANATGYFDKTLYPTFHAQGLKEDFWAMQYYSLIADSQGPVDDFLVKAAAPLQVKVYAVMTYNASQPEPFPGSNEYYRKEKTAILEHIAGSRGLAKPIRWCMSASCSLSFPVNQPAWTAQQIATLVG